MKKKKKTGTETEFDSEFQPLSDNELSMLRQSVNEADVDRSKLPPHDNSDKATFFRMVKQNIFLSVCAIFVAVSLVFLAIAGSIMLITSATKSFKKFTYEIGEADKAEPYELPYRKAVRDGVLYIDMRKIADETNMIISGTETRIQFTSKNGTYMLFEDRNENVIINGGRTTIIAEEYTTGKKVNAPAFVSADECLVPFSFLAKTIDSETLRMEVNKDERTVIVRPRYTALMSDPENKTMKNVLFITSNFDMTLPETERPVYKYNYTIDVSEYLDSMTTEDLTLANKDNPLGADYSPDDLVNLQCPTDGGKQRLRVDAANSLYAMMLEMEAAGITDTYVTSSYRDYEYQRWLYWDIYVERYLNQGFSQAEAEEKASAYSARPGESEHQTGLCLDFTTTSIGESVERSFENTEAFKWLSQNAYKYGFILRYPEDKEAITGYDYEPWHYRFVGRQAASEMYFSNQCLEEYMGVADPQ